MSSVVPLNLGLGDLRPTSRGLVIAPRTKSAFCTQSRDDQRKNTLRSNSATSVQSAADESLSLSDIEGMLSQKVEEKSDDLKAAFQAFDLEGNSTVTKGEFRRVIEGFLIPLTQSQFEALLANVPKKGNGSISYMEFLRRYCKVSTVKISIPYISGGQRNWTLGELQCRLKDKIGSNLKNITRAFRLFDFNRDGRIQQHELHRVLEGYCFPLSQQEFHRLWSHYSPNNTETLSYKEFLEKLGTDCENYRKIAPDSTKLALNWDAVNRIKKRWQSKTSAWTVLGKTEDALDEIHTMFLKKINMNYNLIWRAMQAFDITGSGFISQEDLKSVLCNFLFPLNDSTFQGLLRRFGVPVAESVQWKQFLALFRDEGPTLAVREDAGQVAPGLSSIETVLPKLQQHIKEVYPLLKRAFLIFDENRTGSITCGELRRVVEGLTFHLTDEQFRELTDLLDVECTGVVNYQRFLEIFHPQRPPLVQEQRRMTGTPESQAQPTEMPPVTPAIWSTVEGLLRDKLSEQFDAVMVSLGHLDQAQQGTVSLEDCKRVIQRYGLPVSDNHFNKLCEPFMESGRVHYKQLFKSLDIPKRSDEIKRIKKTLSLNERNDDAYRAHVESIKNRAVEDVVLKKLRERLVLRGVSLHGCLMATSGRSQGMLSLKDFSRILDDCRIFLNGQQLKTLIQALGFSGGQISHSDFVAKYEETITKDRNADPHRNSKNLKGKPTSFMSAEDCLSQMRKRIKEFHGDVLTAFRLMDKNRDGIVNRNDFRDLFDSLMFVIKEREYQRLLDLLALSPGATLNYAEFLSRVQSNSKTGVQSRSAKTSERWLDQACDQVHKHLVTTARNGWPEMLKAFGQYGEDGESAISKNDLKHFLYRYSLPITPDEFDQLWMRYDEEGRGYLTQSEFLEKLNVAAEGEGQGSGHASVESQSDSEMERRMDRGVSVTPRMEATLQDLGKWIKGNFKDVSCTLTGLDKNRDGCVKVEDLLTLLHRHGFQIDEPQLLRLLNNLGIDTHHRKLSYLDFLGHLTGSSASRPMVDSPTTRSMLSLTMGESPIPGESVEEVSPERALHRVREVVTTSSDTLYKAFSAFDKAGSGVMPPLEFRRVLDHFCARLSDGQFRQLLVKLAVKEGEGSKVDWKEFLRAFSLHNQETAEEWLEKIERVGFPNQARPLPISDILGRIQEVVSARLYTIAKEMVDLDYARINVISKEDYKMICDRLFLRLTSDQFENLWKMLPVNAFGNLEYREFLKMFSGEAKGQDRLGSAEGEKSTYTPPSPAETKPAAPRRPKTASCSAGRSSKSLELSGQPKRPSTAGGRTAPLLNCEATERRVHSHIHGCWREIQRRCRELDTERLGEIDVGSFLAIMEDLNIKLTRLEFEQLAVKYDIRDSGRFSYPDFLRHFVLMLRPQATSMSSRPKLHLPRTPLSAGPLSGQCAEAMLRMCGPVQQFWRSMRQSFVSFDKDRSGKISLQDFRKVLRRYSVNLSEEEFFHLTSFFDKNISGKISYNDFLRAFLR